jgi:hypothetical protein
VHIDNMQDGIDPRGVQGSLLYMHDSMLTNIRDDVFENDDNLNILIEDVYFTGHSMISARGTATEANPVSKLHRVVGELRLAHHLGDHGIEDLNHAGGYPFPDNLGNGALFKWGNTGTVEVIDCTFLVNRPATSSMSAMKFAPGTYQNVTIVWLGAGDYPWPAPPGVTITRDRTVYDQAKAAFFAAHPQFTEPLPGDMDGNGAVNNFDIAAFEMALARPDLYLQQYPTLPDYAQRGDINQDGSFNNFDIGPYETAIEAAAAASAQASSMMAAPPTASADPTGAIRMAAFSALPESFAASDPFDEQTGPDSETLN